jgi:hypothetical protein
MKQICLILTSIVPACAGDGFAHRKNGAIASRRMFLISNFIFLIHRCLFLASRRFGAFAGGNLLFSSYKSVVLSGSSELPYCAAETLRWTPKKLFVTKL